MEKTSTEKISVFEQRKQDHIRWALDEKTQGLASSDFDRIRLKHWALPETQFSDVQLTTKILGHKFSSPHFISSMTAGHKQGEKINFTLAAAAAKKNWLMCVGSQKKELMQTAPSGSVLHSEWEGLKNKFPELKLVSNIGIEEVINTPVQKIADLVKRLDAIGLIVHLNPLQEVFQKEQASYKNSLKSLALLVRKLKVPIVVKEVGFGISYDLARELFAKGVQAVDIAGRGGSHWAMIEALRQPTESSLQDSALAFKDWGLSAVEGLLSYKKLLHHEIWASGGVRSGVDSAKCLALGARAVGLAQPLMKAVVHDLANAELSNASTEVLLEKNSIALLHVMERFDFELKTAVFCTGFTSAEALRKSASDKKKVWYESR